MGLQGEISKSFHLTSNDADLLRELESLCNVYSLTPDKLRMKWEAFALSSQCDLKPTLPFIKILKNSLQREFERGLKTRRTVKGRVNTKVAGAINFADYGLDDGDNNQDDSVENFMANVFGGSSSSSKAPVSTTTRINKVAPFATTQSTSSLADTQLSQTSSQFINRKATHVIETQHNVHLPLPTNDDVDMGDDVDDRTLSFSTQKPVQPYRYMFEKIKEKSEGTDERIDYIGSLIEKAYGIEAFGNPTRPGQEAIYAYGLVCSDSSEGKLNEKSVVLQTSRDLGMGRRVPLDLSKVDSYTLFPGQVIGMRGTNHNGNQFQVEKIYIPPTPDKIDSEPKQNKTVDIVIAAGPYTLDDDLSYRPLEELLTRCSEQKPDVILLMGPFLSIHHPKIASANIEALPEQIFREQVTNRLEHLLETSCTNTHVFIVPHANDYTHRYNLFPQPPFENLNIKHSRIHLSSNPSSMIINGQTIYLGNIDVLFKLGKEEISKNPVQSDRFTRLVDHVLQQHTYYPLYPYALGDNIDSERMIDIQLTCTPDILILPSQFKHFVKLVSGAVCINPGYLCKHQAGGNYARVILYPRENVDERVRVDLLKL